MFIIVPHNQQQCIKRESSIHSRTPKNISCHVYTLCSPSLTWADACIKETIAQSDFMDFILLFAVAVVGGVLVVSSVFFASFIAPISPISIPCCKTEKLPFSNGNCLKMHVLLKQTNELNVISQRKRMEAE